MTIAVFNKTNDYVVAFMLIFLSLITYLSLFVFKFIKYERPFLLFVVLFLLIAPFRVAYSVVGEGFHQASLFEDPFIYKSELEVYRIATVMDVPWSQNIYAAQSSIKGYETFGGISVFYNKDDALSWIDNIYKPDQLDNKELTAFKAWNNRIEITNQNFNTNSDAIIKYFAINNVEFIRSLSPINNSMLMLHDIKIIYLPTLKSLALNRPSIKKTYYLYKIRNPKSRILSVPAYLVNNQATHPFRYSDNHFDDKMIQNAINVPLLKYYPGKLNFNYNSKNDNKLIVSNNYNSDWQLYINGINKSEAIRKGPSGSIEISPLKGFNNYLLIAIRNTHKEAILNAISGIILIVLSVYLHNKSRNNPLQQA